VKHHSALFNSFHKDITHAFFERTERPKEEQACDMLTGSFVRLKQIHSSHVITVENPELIPLDAEGDALVTRHKGIILGVVTADCAPVLFYDPVNKVIGAAHAGWKGAVAGILENTLDAMENIGAERETIHAALGPTIYQKHYEVGPEFPEIILNNHHDYEDFFIPSQKTGHHYFCLPTYVRRRLERAGIKAFEDTQLDTFTGPFFSRRETLHKGEELRGRGHLSAIAIRPEM